MQGMVKALKNLFIQNQERSVVLKVYQVCPNHDPRLTFDLFTTRSICIPIFLYGENTEKLFSQNHVYTFFFFFALCSN